MYVLYNSFKAFENLKNLQCIGFSKPCSSPVYYIPEQVEPSD